MEHPLDDPIWSALTGPNARFAVRRGKAVHFHRDVAPFSAIAEPSDEAYADLAVDLPSGALARMFRPAMEPLPDGWDHVEDFPLLQMTALGTQGPNDRDFSAVSVLGLADIGEMIDLVTLTEPGPLGPRTPELGTYVGIRQHGRLVAMGGERMRVPGYVELSAICTAPDARGRGHAELLVRHLMQLASDRSEIPFLHVAADNKPAIALYEKLGFRVRKVLHVLRRRYRG